MQERIFGTPFQVIEFLYIFKSEGTLMRLRPLKGYSLEKKVQEQNSKLYTADFLASSQWLSGDGLQ